LEVSAVKSPGSFEWLRDQVSAAVQQRAKDNNPLGKDAVSDVYVSETYPDFAIVRDYGQNKWWKVPYSMDDKNVVTLGEATEVAQTWTDITKTLRMLVPVQKADTPPHMRQITYGVVAEPTPADVLKADLQGDVQKAEDIELMAHGFMERSQAAGEMHKTAVPLAKVVESFIAPCDFVVKTADGDETILKGSWVLAMKWPDDLWAKIEKGDYTGYSIGGTGYRTPITDATGAQQSAVSKGAGASDEPVPLNWLWGVDVNEVSAVTKGANAKKFFLLKSIPDQDPDDPGSIAKTEQPSLFGWVREAFRKVAGASGPTDGGTEMTPEEVKKAVTDALAEGLKPITDRIEKLEATEPAPTEGASVTKIEGEPEPAPAAEPTAEAVMKTTITEAVAAGLQPLDDRIKKLEEVQGQRQSGLDENSAHHVQKNAEGGFSWQGSGLLM
jgi:hypothetical protein